MSKDDIEDFGFTFVDQSIVEDVAIKAEDKFNRLYNMVMPLLNNLAKDDGKEYIRWPDRAVKMNGLIKKIKDLQME